MSINPFKLPTPNLKGDYAGSCILCLRGTDTVLAIEGEAEFHIAGLMNLGIPDAEAFAMVETSPGQVWGGRRELIVKVCAKCAAALPGVPSPVVFMEGARVPTLRQSVATA